MGGMENLNPVTKFEYALIQMAILSSTTLDLSAVHQVTNIHIIRGLTQEPIQ